MKQILIVIPFHKGDQHLAQRLLDWILVLNGKKKIGHVLLAAANDVHQEQIEHLKVSAELAFETFDAIKVVAKDADSMRRGVAGHIARAYRMPWFWCEPDLTPLSPKWIKTLTDSYYEQPKRYCGSQMRAGTAVYPCRCIIHPPDAIVDMAESGNAQITDKMTKTRLVREIKIATLEDYGKVESDVIAVHPDKQGIAIAAREQASRPKTSNPVLSKS